MKARLTALALGLALAASAGAASMKENPVIAAKFKEAGVKGTFVLYDVKADTFTVHDRQRAERRYFPASTFKIPNALIGLSTGIVGSVDEVLPYGGKPQRIKSWERDQSLRDGIKVSAVPVFQELARRVGLPRMREELAKLDYGNNETGDVVDTFWLGGPLKISALEQTRFLAKLSEDRLPFSPAAMAATRDIILQQKTRNAALFAKTGWTDAPNPDIGWWVGWVRKDGQTYAFALNIDIHNDEDGAKRVPLGRAALAALGLFPAPGE